MAADCGPTKTMAIEVGSSPQIVTDDLLFSGGGLYNMEKKGGMCTC